MSERTLGHASAAFAFALWGFFPLYFARLDALAPPELLAWRIVCSVVTLAPIMLLRPGPRTLLARLGAPGQLRLACLSSALIGVNWLVFIDAVTSGRVIETSLGYFLVPLVNSALGMLLFGERPDPWRGAAIAVAAAGMLGAFAVSGALPLVSLLLAGSFGLYGAVRKGVALDSATGLLFETLLLAPFALLYLLLRGTSPASLPPETLAWLLGSGALTLLPLFSVVVAARRIEMGTLGVYQYIAPTMHLAFAITVFGEKLDAARAVALATTLAAVGLWSAGAWRGYRRGRAA